MPSLLASAALAALAGSGGRKLSTVPTACTHDICGRKLLTRASSHGSPVINADYNADAGLYINGHKIPGLVGADLSIDSNNKVKVSVTVDTASGEYEHDKEYCHLIVTPSIVEATGGAPRESISKDVTSRTFNPSTGSDANGNPLTYAQVSPKASLTESTETTQPDCEITQKKYWDGTKCYEKDEPVDANDLSHPTWKKIDVTLDDPQLDDHSLGFLSVDLDIQFDCRQNRNLAPETVHIKNSNDGSGALARVKHTFTETSVAADKVDFIPGAISLTQNADWAQYGPKLLPVSIGATVTAATDYPLRFPAGEWDSTFGEAQIASNAKLSCTLSEGTIDSSVITNDIKTRWYASDAHNKQVMQGSYGTNGQAGKAEDVACADNDADVSCGRTITATVATTTANGIGFQVPLAKYYLEVESVRQLPQVVCTESHASGSVSEDVDIAGTVDSGEFKIDGVKKELGMVSKGLGISAGTATTSDFGTLFFSSGLNQPIFETDSVPSIFTIAQNSATSWYDLTDDYDYRFQAVYDDAGVDAGNGRSESGAVSTDEGKIALLIAQSSDEGIGTEKVGSTPGTGVLGALESKVAGYISSKTVSRPIKYGQTRSNYAMQDGANAKITDGAGVSFRRDKSDILLTLKEVGTKEGKVKYTGSGAIANAAFDGIDEPWTEVTGDAVPTVTACQYCADSAKTGEVFTDIRADVATNQNPLSGTGADDANAWQFFKAASAATGGKDSLFDQTVGVWDVNEQACMESGVARAYCRSADAPSSVAGHRCREQKVTFQMKVSKAEEDSRVKAEIPVSREYVEPAAETTPTTPEIAARDQTEYVFDGQSYVQSYNKDIDDSTDLVATDNLGHITNALTFTITDTAAKTYNCDSAAEAVTYSASYRQICDGSTDESITYDVPTRVIYNIAQVTPQAALMTGAGADAASAITEFQLQKHSVTPFDVVIDILQAPSGRAFTNAFKLKVTHAKLDGGFQDLTVSSDTSTSGCVLSSGKATCTLKGFEIEDYDSDQALPFGVVCGTDNGNGGTHIDCPQLALTMFDTFNVPKTDKANAFQGSAEPDDVCGGTAREHQIGTGSVELKVKGSEKLYRGPIRLQYQGANAPFAAVAAESGDKATGSTGEHQSDVALATGCADADKNTNCDKLPQKMNNLLVKFEFEQDTTTGAAKKYALNNIGTDYRMYVCPAYQFDFCAADDGSVPRGMEVITDEPFQLTPSQGTPDKGSLYVHIVSNHNAGDPCENKLLGDDAYNGGIQFTVKEVVGQDNSVEPPADIFGPVHTYTVPVKCHTPGQTTLSIPSEDNPKPNGISWNQEALSVLVSGSTIDPDVAVKIDALPSTLTQASQAFIETDDSKDDFRVAKPVLHFKTSDCADASVTVRRSDGVATQSKSVSCPEHIFGVYSKDASDNEFLVGDDQLLAPAKRYGDIFMIPLRMVGRDQRLWGTDVALRASTGTSDKVEFFGGAAGLTTSNAVATKIAIPDYNQQHAFKNVLFKIVPPADTPISCNQIELELSSMTVKETDQATAITPKTFKFRVACPVQREATKATDSLTLHYNVQAFSYGHSAMSITLQSDPSGISGLTSIAGLGECSVDDKGKPQAEFLTGSGTDADCSLNTGTEGYVTSLPGGELGLIRFEDCAKKSGDGTDWTGVANENGDVEIISKATVAREYTYTDIEERFDDSKFCGETALLLKVIKSQQKDISISVAASANMEFDLHVSALEWRTCTYTDGDGAEHDDGVQLASTVNMLRKLSTDSEFTSNDIQSYFRQQTDPELQSGETDYFSYFDGSDNALVDGNGDHDVTKNGGHTLKMLGPCTSLALANDESRTVEFTMKVDLQAKEYFTAASVSIRATKPDTDNKDELAFSVDDISAVIDCQIKGNDFSDVGSDECSFTDNGESIPSNYIARLTASVINDEATYFSHEFEAPTIKLGSGDTCTMFADCPLVSSLANAAVDYKAMTTATDAMDLVSTDNTVVMLGLEEMADLNDVTIGWVVKRVIPSSRRLRSVQHVAYTLGADGSVSKSTSFGVIPAVRDSEGVSAVTTKEQITREIQNDDGTWRDPYVYNQTTVQLEKTGEDHTLAVLGIVFGGLGSLAAIAVAFFVGCASRRDASGAGTSFKTVAGGFSDRQPLFNRNRFAPSDF